MPKAPKRTISTITVSATNPKKKYTRTGTELMDIGVARPKNLIGGLAGMGVPQRLFPIKHRLCISSGIDPANAVPVQLTGGSIAINNPQATVGGRQPMAWDQFQALYERFKVVKAHVTCHFQAMGNSASVDKCIVGIQFSENSNWSPTTLETLIERGFCRFKPIALSNGSPSVVTVKKTWDLAKWYGPENAKGLSASGTATATPEEIAYLHVFCANGSSSDSSGVWCTMIIDYEVEWFGPKQLDPSS